MLEFPPYTDNIPANTVISPISAKISYVEVATGETKEIRCELALAFLDSGEEVKEIEIDEDVMLNFYRVKGAEVLKEARVLGDNNQFE